MMQEQQKEEEEQPLMQGENLKSDNIKNETNAADDIQLTNESKDCKTIWSVRVKKETTFGNFFAILFAPIIIHAAGTYANAMLPGILQSEEYFGYDYSEVGTRAGTVVFWGFLIATVITPFLGYVYDLIGRWWFMIPSCFFLSIVMSLFPFTAPNFWLLCILRGCVAIVGIIIQTNPLILDYVKSDSRGLVVSYTTFSFVLGELIMVTMFAATRQVSIGLQYWVCSVTIATLTIFLAFLIREPTIRDKSLPTSNPNDDVSNHDVEMTTGQKLKKLSSDVWQEVKERPKYTFVFVCLLSSRIIIVLFSQTMQLWALSFAKSGVLENESEADVIYMRIIIGAIIFIAISSAYFGFFVDKSDMRILVPTLFAIRALCGIGFYWITDPRVWYAYALCIVTIVVSMLQYVAIEALFLRGIKSHIRGTMQGLSLFFGAAGATAFALVAGKLFDNVGSWAPFMLMSGADTCILIFTLVWISAGLLKRTD